MASYEGGVWHGFHALLGRSIFPALRCIYQPTSSPNLLVPEFL